MSCVRYSQTPNLTQNEICVDWDTLITQWPADRRENNFKNNNTGSIKISVRLCQTRILKKRHDERKNRKSTGHGYINLELITCGILRVIVLLRSIKSIEETRNSRINENNHILFLAKMFTTNLHTE